MGSRERRGVVGGCGFFLSGCGAVPALRVLPRSFPTRRSSDLCCICLGDSEVIPLEQAIGEDSFELCQHVAEYQRQFGQVPSERKACKRRVNNLKSVTIST